ncbi:MAG TPA: hypothetical protein VLA16_23885 [Ideonella sp.]|nr:hypothetical protein [Ideonella sp.]
MSARALRLWVAIGVLLASVGAAWLVWREGVAAPAGDPAGLSRLAASPGEYRQAHADGPGLAAPADPAWGPSPFAPGPARPVAQLAPTPAAAPPPPAETSALRAQVHLFELLRSRAEYDAALTHVASEIRDRIEPALQAGEISATEGLLLTGAVLEILEPDSDTRAALLDEWGHQHLPPVLADEGDAEG